VPFHKFRNIELGLLQDLHLSDVAILDGEDAGCLTSDRVTDGGRDEFLHQRLKVSLGSKLGHVCCHLLTDGSDLRRLGVARGLDLVVLRAGESNAEQSDNVSVSGSAVNVGLNDGLLLSDKRAKLISGHVHTVEVQQTVVSLNILNAKLNLAVSKSLVLVKVGKRNLEHTSLQVFRGNFGTLRLGDEGLTAVLDGKDRRSDEFVPFLLLEGVDSLFTASLLGFRKSLVLAL